MTYHIKSTFGFVVLMLLVFGFGCGKPSSTSKSGTKHATARKTISATLNDKELYTKNRSGSEKEPDDKSGGMSGTESGVKVNDASKKDAPKAVIAEADGPVTQTFSPSQKTDDAGQKSDVIKFDVIEKGKPKSHVTEKQSPSQTPTQTQTQAQALAQNLNQTQNKTQNKTSSPKLFDGKKINWGERAKTESNATPTSAPLTKSQVTKHASPETVIPSATSQQTNDADKAKPVISNSASNISNNSPKWQPTQGDARNKPLSNVKNDAQSDAQNDAQSDTRNDAQSDAQNGTQNDHQNATQQDANPFSFSDEAFLTSNPNLKPLPPVDSNEPEKKDTNVDESVWEKQPEADLSELEHIEIKQPTAPAVVPIVPDFSVGPKTITDSVPRMGQGDAVRTEGNTVDKGNAVDSGNTNGHDASNDSVATEKMPDKPTTQESKTTPTQKASPEPGPDQSWLPIPPKADQIWHPIPKSEKQSTQSEPLAIESGQPSSKSEQNPVEFKQHDAKSEQHTVIDVSKPVHAALRNDDDPFAIDEAKASESSQKDDQPSSKSTGSDVNVNSTEKQPATSNTVTVPTTASTLTAVPVTTQTATSTTPLTTTPLTTTPASPVTPKQAVPTAITAPVAPAAPTAPTSADDGDDIFGGDFTQPAVTPPSVAQPNTVQPETTLPIVSPTGTKPTPTKTSPKLMPKADQKTANGKITVGALKGSGELVSEEIAKQLPEKMSATEEYLINEAKLSPVRLLESVELLYQLNKPKLAKPLMQQFIDADVSPDDYVQLTKRLNPATMMQLSSDVAYQPEGAHIARKMIAGAKSYFESRNQVEKAMQRLLSGTDSEKEEAMRVILRGQETTIEFLIERLGATNDVQEEAEVKALLYTIGEDARKAVQEALSSQHPQLAVRAASVIARFGKKSDAQFLFPLVYDAKLSESDRGQIAAIVQGLIGRVPLKIDAAAVLYATATNYYREKVPFRTNENNQVLLWVIKEGSDSVKCTAFAEQDASRYYAEKFARFASQLNPDNATYRQMRLVTYLDVKGTEYGSDNSITINPALVDSIKNDYSVLEIENTLKLAMQHDHAAAARVAAEILGHIGTADMLIYQRSSQSALVKAAGFSDRRVRFAAVSSIMKLDPQRQYPGSSVVSESLVFFTRATGVKRAIVAAPWVGDAAKIAGMLEQKSLGYKPVIATVGRQAMQLAIDSADTELMMIDSRTPNPSVDFLVQDMRADNRTHDVPIGVMAVEGEMTRAERVAFGNKMARAFPRPIDEEAAKFVVENLLRETGVEQVPAAIRLAEAKQSITWVAQLYERSSIYRFENIETIAYNVLREPELTDEALQLIRLVPTATAQRMLTQMISTVTLPLETRQKALEAFRYHTQHNGVQIRGQLILDLYDYYNGSAGEPVASQQIRGSLLDVIEQYANYMQNVVYKK